MCVCIFYGGKCIYLQTLEGVKFNTMWYTYYDHIVYWQIVTILLLLQQLCVLVNNRCYALYSSKRGMHFQILMLPQQILNILLLNHKHYSSLQETFELISKAFSSMFSKGVGSPKPIRNEHNAPIMLIPQARFTFFTSFLYVNLDFT